jgi:biofilm PGA synthesis N-glycosyltransferase PgaC
MTILQFFFAMGLLVIFYAFFGYGLLLYGLVWIKRHCANSSTVHSSGVFEPEVSLVIPCFNEADILREKILNSLKLDYQPSKLKIYFITDGSNDNSKEVIMDFPEVRLLHENRRGGKTAAENRAMRFIKTPIVIFSDANTILNRDAVKNMVRHFKDETVGCVSGEKRILTDEKDNASSSGEGIYWKYESFLKKLDSEFYSAVGAAGELVAFRSSLYEELPEDTILDDFMQSMTIASKGYKIVYEPEAYAMETGSASIKEELKRKIRIGAGGWQSVARLWEKITPARNLKLYFQYFSHRVLRWTVTPFLLVIVFVLNIFLWDLHLLYKLLMICQIFFYLAAVGGYVLENKKIRLKLLFVPFYFCMMNYAVMAGLNRFLRNNQQSVWEKAERKKNTSI